MHQSNSKGFAVIELFIVLAILAAIGAVGFLVFSNKSKGQTNVSFNTNQSGERTISESEAIKAGKQIAGNKCEGKGPVRLTHSPMRSEDIAMILPYGLMVDGHVTPIDHQYFSPANFQSAPDTYEVRAMADGRITQISFRGESVGYQGKRTSDYRFVFSHTCTFLTYFDLVTSLAPDIKTEFDKVAQKNGNMSFAQLDLPVKAGQLMGYIGGQTLDFAVWDTQKPLSGFISPDLYKGESWKIYTADPLDYYTDEVKQLVLDKYLRTDAAKSGKIDWDVDGSLIGNWFAENSNGYEGDRGQADGKYWRGHLAVAPDYLDPSIYIASFGTYKSSGDGEQFMVTTKSSNPKDVTVASGLIKYDLSGWEYIADGQRWDGKSAAKNPKARVANNRGSGCALYQMIEKRKLRAEPFPNKSCTQVNDFTSAAKVYIR